MGVPGRPQPVGLVMGVIYGTGAALAQLEARLAEEFGEIDARSDVFDFDVTEYYQGFPGINTLNQTVILTENTEVLTCPAEGQRRTDYAPGQVFICRCIFLNVFFH